MNFDWRRFLDLARDLDAGAPRLTTASHQEAAWRCAVGRAYYALFGHAREYAQRVWRIPFAGTAEDHRTVMECYRLHPSLGKVGAALGNLRWQRNQCDYRRQVSNVQMMAADCIDEAAEAIKLLV